MIFKNDNSLRMRIILYAIASLLISACSRKMIISDGAILNHLALYVSDLKKSTSFYQNIIGIDTIPEPFHDGKHTWFKIDTHGQLHLIAGATEKLSHNKNTHLCFSVKDMNTIVRKLESAEIAYQNWAGEKNKMTTRVDGIKQIYLQDPDGYWIEVNNDRK